MSIESIKLLLEIDKSLSPIQCAQILTEVEQLTAELEREKECSDRNDRNNFDIIADCSKRIAELEAERDELRKVNAELAKIAGISKAEIIREAVSKARKEWAKEDSAAKSDLLTQMMALRNTHY